MSDMLPHRFQESEIRIFYKKVEGLDAIKASFTCWCQQEKMAVLKVENYNIDI